MPTENDHPPDEWPAAIYTYAATLVHLHLGQAVDSCVISRRFATAGRPGEKPLERRYAIGSILHGYAALEGVANRFRFEVFENNEGRHYAPAAATDLATVRYLAEWRDRVVLEDKLAFLCEKRGRPFVQSSIPQVRELRQYRNLLAHGFTMKALAYFDRVPDQDNLTQLAEQDWYYDKKFPVMNFARPDRVTFSDARRALETVLNAIFRISQTFHESEIAFVYELPDHPLFTIGPDADVLNTLLHRIDNSSG